MQQLQAGLSKQKRQAAEQAAARQAAEQRQQELQGELARLQQLCQSKSSQLMETQEQHKQEVQVSCGLNHQSSHA